MKLFIVLHHTDDPSQAPQLGKVNESHKRRGFPMSGLGYYVGYHWFVGFNGQARQTRKESESGAHCNAKMMNYLGIGICLAGDFTQDKPNSAQIDTLEELLTEIQSRWSIPEENILLHRECKSTSCPGVDLRALALLRRRKLETEKVLAAETNPSRLKSMKRRLARIVLWMTKGVK